METLSKRYEDQLKKIESTIQESTELKKYLEEEDESDYHTLQEKYEPLILELYEEVAAKNPLQLIDLEKRLIEPTFEGLFLPRLLGYAVLRGSVDDQFKYMRSQDHFKDILLAICNSSNFDIIKLRIGQAIQIGFALSSDIWITNLMDEIGNKKIIQFLSTQKLPHYRELKHRKAGYTRFKRQFQTVNFQTADFPKTSVELKILFNRLKRFLEFRIRSKSDHSSYLKDLLGVLSNDELKGSDQYVHLLGLTMNFIDLSPKDRKVLSGIVNRLRSEDSEFSDQYFRFLKNLMTSGFPMNREDDLRVAQLLDLEIKDYMANYYIAVGELAKKGLGQADAIEAIRKLYGQYDGLSTINDCLRRSILSQLVHILKNLSVEEYPEYFELNKLFMIYMDIFDYQHFNQDLKESSIHFVRKLIQHYTDKRSKDYQDIKKFVIPAFQEMGFMREKEVLEFFKTRRKKKVS